MSVGTGAEGFDVAPDDSELWTIRPDGTLVIVDIAATKVVHNIALGLEGGHRLKFTPDGKRVMVVNVKTGKLMVLDARIAVGRPEGVTVVRVR